MSMCLYKYFIVFLLKNYLIKSKIDNKIKRKLKNKIKSYEKIKK